jgi:hypothetical protein
LQVIQGISYPLRLISTKGIIKGRPRFLCARLKARKPGIKLGNVTERPAYVYVYSFVSHLAPYL